MAEVWAYAINYGKSGRDCTGARDSESGGDGKNGGDGTGGGDGLVDSGCVCARNTSPNGRSIYATTS